jgi:hypothetical protein
MTLDEWFLIHGSYHKALDAYNQRLILVRSERERGNWSMKVDNEYRAVHDTQSAALKADETLYQTLLRQQSDIRLCGCEICGCW